MTASAPDDDGRCSVGVCDGSGWVTQPDDSVLSCECRERRIRKARTRGVAAVVPRRYRLRGFDQLHDIDPAVVKVVRQYSEDVDARLDAGEGLWLMGSIGTGKTTLAMLVSKAALQAGRSVAIYSLPDLLREIRRTFGGEAWAQSHGEFFQRLVSVDLLHIDDLGAEKTSEWVLEELYSLINRRYEDQRAVVVTTNLLQDQLEDQISARTVSRLVEICGDPLWLEGDDLRYRIEGKGQGAGPAVDAA